MPSALKSLLCKIYWMQFFNDKYRHYVFEYQEHFNDTEKYIHSAQGHNFITIPLHKYEKNIFFDIDEGNFVWFFSISCAFSFEDFYYSISFNCNLKKKFQIKLRILHLINHAIVHVFLCCCVWVFFFSSIFK